MNEKLDAEICSKYPKMFVNRHADMKTTAMCWGFEHGDGWYNIIDALCSNIQHHIDWSIKNNQADIEHNKMLADMKAGNFEEFNRRSELWADDYKNRVLKEHMASGPRRVREIVPQVVVVQVKEKFGSLRFYYDGGDDVIRGMVSVAESMSSRTCEKCGAPGKRVGGGWITTLCKTHAEEAGIFETEEESNDI